MLNSCYYCYIVYFAFTWFSEVSQPEGIEQTWHDNYCRFSFHRCNYANIDLSPFKIKRLISCECWNCGVSLLNTLHQLSCPLFKQQPFRLPSPWRWLTDPHSEDDWCCVCAVKHTKPRSCCFPLIPSVAKYQQVGTRSKIRYNIAVYQRRRTRKENKSSPRRLALKNNKKWSSSSVPI